MTAPLVHVIDDDEPLRDSIRMILAHEGLTAQTYASADAFLAAPASPTGCVVTDVRMPGMSGIELLTQIAARRLALPVIVLTGHADVALAVDAMKKGAVDFLEKPFKGEDLIEAVRRALKVGQDSRRVALTSQEAHARLGSLTARETEVLDRLVKGQPNKVIAFEMGISPRTVEVHRANVMKKTQAGSLPDLVRMFLNVERD
jgi:two-component system response regulator FixJ